MATVTRDTIESEEQRKQRYLIEDLAMLLGRSAYALKRFAPGNPMATELADRAIDFLKQNNLQGSPLRTNPVNTDGEKTHG